VGDFNGDGMPDLAVANEYWLTILRNASQVSCAPGKGCVSTNPAAEVFLGNGDGTFQSPGFAFEFNVAPSSIAAADFNQDGNLDLAFGVSRRGETSRRRKLYRKAS